MTAVGKRGHGHAPLHFLQRCAHPDGNCGAIVRFGSGVAYSNVEFDDVVGHDVRALHIVPQLAHIAGPRMLVQADQRVARESLGGTFAAVEVIEEELCQLLDVRTSVAQRWQPDRKHVQAVIQVFT